MVSNGPIVQFSFGSLIKPLADEFETDRATLSSAVLIAFTATAIFTPFAGRLVDRFGVRPVVLPAIVLFALAIAALSLSPSSAYGFLFFYGVLGIFAAGQTPLPYAKSVAGCFDAKRGLALGISMAGVGLGAAIIPQVTQALITSVGWRNTYLALAVIVFAVGFPAALLLLKEPARAGTGPLQLEGLGAQEAAHSRQFWSLVIIFLTMVMACAGVIAHIVPILTDAGVNPQLATSAVGSAGLALIIGRLIVGYLLDKIFAPYVTLFFLLVILFGIGLLQISTSPMTAVMSAMCIGLGLGAEIDLLAYLISRYFGMRSFGTIYGYMFAAFNIGCGLGPFLMGLSQSQTGSYGTAILTFAVGLMVAVALVFGLGPYRYASASKVELASPVPASV
ncbi:MFS transporter [Bradyrhizobium prioriisuperbiae]|uniref:MFS transporter n=1 Tax=Bradyrhizobium prioriisuperbiae TaxID=2854389 RepID=UPI0028E57A1D|nr:MFS transporter [Bradyrhizobium prioritasuperba]